jgi:hypothetical protein
MPIRGSEAWTITVAEQNRVEAMGMQCSRRMMKIKRIDRNTKEEVLREVKDKINIMNTLR